MQSYRLSTLNNTGPTNGVSVELHLLQHARWGKYFKRVLKQSVFLQIANSRAEITDLT